MVTQQAEINKFDQLADQWWQPQGSLKTLHQINPLRLQFIHNYCPDLQNQTIVDIGCGGGILSESLALEGARVTGIDLSTQAIQAAQHHAQHSNLAIDYQTIDSHIYADQHPAQFDIVTCMELLEHVEEPDTLIADCASLLKPGGWLFASTLNRRPKSYLLGIVAAEYLLNLLPRGTHDYAHFIKPSELTQSLRHNNLQLEALKGLSYLPFSKTFQLTDDISVNYLAAAQKQD